MLASFNQQALANKWLVLFHVPVQRESPCAAFPTGPTLPKKILLVAKAQRGIIAAGAPVSLAQGPGASHHHLSSLCPLI